MRERSYSIVQWATGNIGTRSLQAVIEHLGRALGADNDAVFGGLLGVDADRLAELRAAGVI